ncbi:MAG: toll/interleukin-1 receptor domain-containing protein [Xanthobacteraceae bacterium]
MSAPIFISYSSKDQDIAETICKALESRGQNCWISCRDVRAGDNFQEAIVRALRTAKVMLLVFTSNANNSDEIKKELVLAGRHHVTVVPVRVEDVVPNDAFSYEFATRQWIDLFKNWEQEIELLSSRLEHVLQDAKPGETVSTPAATAVPRRLPQKSSNAPLIWGAIALIAIIVIGGAVFLLRPSPKPVVAAAPPPAAPTMAPAPTLSAPQQTAAQAPAPVAAPPVTPAPPPAPQVAEAPVAPPPVAQQSPEDAAWLAADNANTPDLFSGYLKSFPYGAHLQEAQLRLVNLIRTSAPPIKTFDGTWQTEWTCPNLGGYPGYSYSFNGQMKDGVYHGAKGAKGEPSSMTLDGKIEADGTAGFTGEVIVGSSLVGLGAARGSPSDFHALGHFDHGSGNGKRIEGRPCTLTFLKQ